MELKFGIAAAVLVMAGVVGAAVGYSYGYVAGYQWGFEKANVASAGPPGEPLDLTKVDWTQVKGLTPPAQSPTPASPAAGRAN